MSRDPLTPEMLRQISRLELRTRRWVDSALVGAYRSAFKGRGTTFDGVRPYVAGDDVRAIDWNVSARAGEPYIKQYVEERELVVMVVIDDSASMRFGTRSATKRERAAELTAALALIAVRGGDRVGVMVAGDEARAYLPPRRGRGHVLRAIRLASAPSTGQRLDLGDALRAALRLMLQRGVMFVVSDFLGDAAGFARPLGLVGKRHEVICAVADDPLERLMPAAGLMMLEDAETGQRVRVDSADKAWQKAFAAQVAERVAARDRAIARAGAARFSISTDSDPLTALARFLRGRAR
jgi:uncharacterized protein (DUF58 family)